MFILSSNQAEMSISITCVTNCLLINDTFGGISGCDGYVTPSPEHFVLDKNKTVHPYRMN